MELIFSFIGVLSTVLVGFLWLNLTLGRLKKRLEGLETKLGTQQLEILFNTAQEKLQANQQQLQQMIEQFEGLRQEIRKFQRTVQTDDSIATLAETLPEITFEAAFIDRDKKIRRETRKARQLTEILPGNVKLELIYIPGGSFMMGSNDGYQNEKPLHPVTLKSFFAGKYPITQAQWKAVMGNNPAYFKGKNHPVENVNWHEAMEYCTKLSQLTGQQYCLLSEARWEYACRARTATQYSFGDFLMPELANYQQSDIKQTTDVGTYPANGFGLYDMHGNVWEWCEDAWHENYDNAPSDGHTWEEEAASKYHLLRGGAWSYGDDRLRCADRLRQDAMSRFYTWGFRISRT